MNGLWWRLPLIALLLILGSAACERSSMVDLSNRVSALEVEVQEGLDGAVETMNILQDQIGANSSELFETTRLAEALVHRPLRKVDMVFYCAGKPIGKGNSMLEGWVINNETTLVMRFVPGVAGSPNATYRECGNFTFIPLDAQPVSGLWAWTMGQGQLFRTDKGYHEALICQWVQHDGVKGIQARIDNSDSTQYAWGKKWVGSRWPWTIGGGDELFCTIPLP